MVIDSKLMVGQLPVWSAVGLLPWRRVVLVRRREIAGSANKIWTAF
jgi:hypothetical protein